jgi:hypothetical protein
MRRSASEIIRSLEGRIARLEKQADLYLESDTENIAQWIVGLEDVRDNWSSLDDRIQEGLEKLGVFANILVIKGREDSPTEYKLVVAPEGKRSRVSIIYDKTSRKVTVVKGNVLKTPKPKKVKQQMDSPNEISTILLDNGGRHHWLHSVSQSPIKNDSDKTFRVEKLLSLLPKRLRKSGVKGIPARMDARTKQAIIDLWLNTLPNS